MAENSDSPPPKLILVTLEELYSRGVELQAGEEYQIVILPDSHSSQ